MVIARPVLDWATFNYHTPASAANYRLSSNSTCFTSVRHPTTRIHGNTILRFRHIIYLCGGVFARLPGVAAPDGHLIYNATFSILRSSDISIM
jgi:hypothetical protein